MKELKVNQIYVFIATDKDGNEGIVGFMDPQGLWMAMVCADWDRAQSFKPIAQNIANKSGEIISLIKLEIRSHIEDIKPESKQ